MNNLLAKCREAAKEEHSPLKYVYADSEADLIVMGVLKAAAAYGVFADAILGYDPPRFKVDDLQKRNLGHFVGGFVDKWSWNQPAVRALSNKDQIDLYRYLKDEWVVAP